MAYHIVAIYGMRQNYFSLRYSLPPFINYTTRLKAVMSSSGLPSVATRSASNPGAIVPIRFPIPSDSADTEVALTTASIGVSWASRTRYTNSSALRPCDPATASVPNVTFTLWARAR